MRNESYHVEDDCTLVLTYGADNIKVNIRIPNRTLKEALDVVEAIYLPTTTAEIIIV